MLADAPSIAMNPPMGRLASSLVVMGGLGFVTAFGTAVGCAGNGTDDPLPDVGNTVTTEAGTDSSSGRILPPKKEAGAEEPGGDDDTTGDDDDDDIFGGPTDGGSDSGVDAGPPPPPPVQAGDPCTAQDEIRKQACGMCGTNTTVCEKNPSDGTLHWSGFSPCEGEHGECIAGTSLTEECNNCGTRPITCSNQCKWTTGTCSAAANTGCAPLTYDIVNAGCSGPDLGLYRVRQCKATCDYEPYSLCSAPPTSIEVGRTVGAVSSTVAQLGGSIAKVAVNSCPVGASTSLGAGTAYAYTQVHNPLPTDVTVIVYNSIAPAGKVIDTAIAVYNGDTAPTTVDARKACVKASTSGNATYTGDSKFASLDSATKKVTIPANGYIMVYSASENTTDSGPVRVSVKTDAIAKP